MYVEKRIAPPRFPEMQERRRLLGKRGARDDDMERAIDWLLAARAGLIEHKLEPTYVEYAPGEAIPDSFDAREAFPECASVIGRVRDQSDCGSCWAFASTEVRGGGGAVRPREMRVAWGPGVLRVRAGAGGTGVLFQEGEDVPSFALARGRGGSLSGAPPGP